MVFNLFLFPTSVIADKVAALGVTLVGNPMLATPSCALIETTASFGASRLISLYAACSLTTGFPGCCCATWLLPAAESATVA
ncbi:hypothetical protein M3M35_04260 [Fructilactobacillus myrtifloralis]|uniref:Secreted protein n=1 Tax=Fructilactobacillus myrtifloralis TaxID=2940301 RepID=A0ABY5BLJ1_9LACO|nr:hypothetical protein [Fructilactobacillus myrtifloralis]USS84540.1 hypothetical protein M3M35_04260 [Fructilactobacillus myrtifloralis]